MSADPAPPDARPPSDVSAVVGWLGVAGLLLWIGVCHYWPQIADALQLPGPRERLTGPYAA
ncbi:MAG TPA: protein-S-isoprenylcysteine methyltransferase, partial [Novosphingobium sp.]|nr:protein-S-isoprenylcysteine methyltransferase [Novosphingobium sp.]